MKRDLRLLEFRYLFIAYPVFIFMCIALSMDTLIRPGPTGRFMGAQAREKARSWLVGASFILLVVAVLVGFAILWVLQNAQQSAALPELYGNIAPTLGVMDLILSLLIGAVVLLVGQAIVSYGIFTGKPLPQECFQTTMDLRHHHVCHRGNHLCREPANKIKDGVLPLTGSHSVRCILRLDHLAISDRKGYSHSSGQANTYQP